MSDNTTTTFAVDFSDIDEFGPMPDGDYPLQIEEAEMKEGNEFPYLALKLQVLDEDFADRMIFHNMTMSPKPFARKQLFNFLKFAGVPEDELRSGSFVLDPDALAGVTIYARLITEEYEGEKQNKVKRFLADPEEAF